MILVFAVVEWCTATSKISFQNLNLRCRDYKRNETKQKPSLWSFLKQNDLTTSLVMAPFLLQFFRSRGHNNTSLGGIIKFYSKIMYRMYSVCWTRSCLSKITTWTKLNNENHYDKFCKNSTNSTDLFHNIFMNYFMQCKIFIAYFIAKKNKEIFLYF